MLRSHKILSPTRTYLFIFICILYSACKKNETSPNYPAGSNEATNTWILDSLKRYYYWNETLPSNPNINISPKDFLSTVRNPSDRFSYIIITNDPSTGIPANKNFGFDYNTILEQNTNQVIGIIKLVLNDSPASRAGLKRGDYFNKINGQQITANNAQSLQQEILNNNGFSLGLVELNNNNWFDKHTVEVGKGVILDQKALSKIIEADGKKIGYLYLQDFNPGLASSILTNFSNFKSTGITELILDLRYNSGGQVAEAAGICAMIAPGISYDKPFIIYKGNKNGGQRTESIGAAATFDKTVNFNLLLQNNLSLSRIYILGTAATASASEVMINNLKPFMQVVLIGGQTRGKDEASFKIADTRIPKQVQWELHPIVYKLFNASGNGGYSQGILPDIPVNELASLPLLPFGEITDPLVKSAISKITGKTIASSARLKQSIPGNFTNGTILTDSRAQTTEQSIVTTHP